MKTAALSAVLVLAAGASTAATLSDATVTTYGVGSNYSIGQLRVTDTKFESNPFSRTVEVEYEEGISSSVSSLNQDVTSSFGNDGDARLSFGGSLGASVSTSPDPDVTYSTTARSVYFDILSFGSAAPTTADFTLSLDATLSSLTADQGTSTAVVNVNLLDITGFNGQLLERYTTGGYSDIAVTSAAYGDYSGLQVKTLVSMVADEAGNGFGPDFEEFVNTDGTDYYIDRTVGGSFDIGANRDYLLLFSVTATYLGNGAGEADALNTGVFSFNGGQSLNLTSASGASYQATPAVPLPAGAWLLASGLGAFGIARRKRRG